MERIKRSQGSKIICVLLACTFIIADISWAYPTDKSAVSHTLAVETGFQSGALSGPAGRTELFLHIGKYLLGDPEHSVRPLPLEHMEYCVTEELGQPNNGVDLRGVKLEDGIVIIPYTNGNKRYDVRIALKETPQAGAIQGHELKVSEVYTVKISRSVEEQKPALQSAYEPPVTGLPNTDLPHGSDNTFDPIYGERMYKTIPHTVTIAVMATSIEQVRKTLEFVRAEQASYPANYRATPVLIGLIKNGGDLDHETVVDLDDANISYEIVACEKNDYSELMFRLRDKAYYDYGSTILSIISDQATYNPGDISKNIKSLMYYRKPSVIVSAINGESRVEEFKVPADFTFYTDAYYVRDRLSGANFLTQISQFLVLNNRSDNTNSVKISLTHEPDFRNIERWHIHEASPRVLIPVKGMGAINSLPRDQNILFFEPHPDDYVLSAATIMKNLMVRGNKIDMVGVFSGSESDYWPSISDVRIAENMKAFNSIYEVASGINASARPIVYKGMNFDRRTNGLSNRDNVDRELGVMLSYMELVKPSVIAIPAEEDTHRHHVRMRELALKAAGLYVKKTGLNLRVFSVPLFSAEEKAYRKANRFVFQNIADCADKRHALDVYRSQEEYVQGELYRERHAKAVGRMHDILHAITYSGYAVPSDAIECESFADEMMIGKDDFRSGFHIEFVDHNSFRLVAEVEGQVYTIRYAKGSASLETSTIGDTSNPKKRPSIKIMEEISDMLLDDIRRRDPERSSVFDRVVRSEGTSHDPLYWLTDTLAEVGELGSINYYDKDVLIALKVLFEKIVGEIEDMKLKQGVLRQKMSPPNRDLYEERRLKRQKLVIGIPSHKSEELIYERLINIRDQIRDFPAEWKHWDVEIVLCLNGKPEDLREMGEQTVAQIPKDIFQGIANPIRIVVLKEGYPNQPNALNAIYKYAANVSATMVSITDDDVKYDRYAMKNMITTLLSTKEKCLVGARFYWRRRSTEVLYKEALDELSAKRVVGKLPTQILCLLAVFRLPLKMLWQEIAIFRRRPDIPFSPKVVMGAASVSWADDYKNIPYWIRQPDVWWRYRYTPYSILAEGATASSVAARTFSYYLIKRSRSFYGYQNDINKIFSKRRRQLQDDGDVYYRRHIRSIGIETLKTGDKIFLFLSLAVYEFVEWLFKHFKWFFNRPRFFWSLAERGADTHTIPPSESFLTHDTVESGGTWDQLTMDPRHVAFYSEKMDDRQEILRQVYVPNDRQFSYYHEAPVFAEDFKPLFLHTIETAGVDESGLPIISDIDLNRLAYVLYRSESNRKPVDFIKSSVRVFCDIYAAPDARASEIMANRNIAKAELLNIFEYIKDSETLQGILMEHPIHRNFFDKMKGLLGESDQVKNMINREATFPLALEMHPAIACNSRCTFCYSRDRWFYKETTAGHRPLTADDWIKQVDDAADHGVHKIYALGGLEPLMAMGETIAILDRAKERGVGTGIFTNGILIDPKNERLTTTLLGIDQVFVSLRAMTAQTYEKVTKTEDFDKVIKGITYLVKEKQARKSRTSIGIAYFVTPDNFRELPELFAFASRVGVDCIGLGSDNLDVLPGFTESDRNDLKAILRKLAVDVAKKSYGNMKINLNDTLLALSYPSDELPGIYKYQLRRSGECQTWFIKSAINPFGKVFNCCLLAQPGFSTTIEPLGQITHSMPLSGIMSSSKTKVHNARQCSSCNPSENNGLIAFAKIKDDYEAGIPLEMQPFQVRHTLDRAEFDDAVEHAETLNGSTDVVRMRRMIKERYDIARIYGDYYFTSPDTVTSSDPWSKVELKKRKIGFSAGASADLVYIKGVPDGSEKNKLIMNLEHGSRLFKLVARSRPYGESHMILGCTDMPQGKPERDGIAASLEMVRVLGDDFEGVTNIASYSYSKFHSQFMKKSSHIRDYPKEQWPVDYEEYSGDDAGKLADVILERYAYYRARDGLMCISFTYDTAERKYKVILIPIKRGHKQSLRYLRDRKKYSGTNTLELSGYAVAVKDERTFDGLCASPEQYENALRDISWSNAVKHPLAGLPRVLIATKTAANQQRPGGFNPYELKKYCEDKGIARVDIFDYSAYDNAEAVSLLNEELIGNSYDIIGLTPDRSNIAGEAAILSELKAMTCSMAEYDTPPIFAAFGLSVEEGESLLGEGMLIDTVVVGDGKAALESAFVGFDRAKGLNGNKFPKLFSAVTDQGHVNSRRAKIIETTNRVTDMIGERGPSGPIEKDKLGNEKSAAEMANRIEFLAAKIESQGAVGVPSDARSLIEFLKNNIDQLEADSTVAAIVVMARRAARQGKENCIIGLGTDWIPGIDKTGYGTQHDAINLLMKEIDSLNSTLRLMGVDNVEIIHESEKSLVDSILKSADATHTRLSNVVVLASKDTIADFDKKLGANIDAKERPFLAAVDPEELDRWYRENTDNESQIDINIVEMLSIALEMAVGKEKPNLPIISGYDSDRRLLLLTPKPAPFKYWRLKEIYEARLTALRAA